MLPSKARWLIKPIELQLVEQISREMNMDPLMARLLAVRGISNHQEAQLFLSGGSDFFHDPFLLDGMKQAVERIGSAIHHKEKIRVYGDYDADGVSSTSLMIHLFRQLNANFDYYIPHRVAEGYGLNRNALDHARENGIALIVTVDNGISAADEIDYAASLGIDVIVTDHHEPPENLPQAIAVINPRKPGCPYPFKQLAGVGVAFKLAHAMLGRLPEELLELAAIGTVADLMPLSNENRLMVKLGLQRMQHSANVGIKALLGIAGMDSKEVTAAHIGYALAPRINASGRLDHAEGAVRLLTTTSEQEAEHLALDLDQLNQERQRIVEEMAKRALQQMEHYNAKHVTVLAEDNWNVGIAGIVASKVQEKFYRPTLILSIDPETGIAKGSARSIAGFDMYQALTRCADLLEHYGGHQAAAGMTLHKDHIEPLKQRLNLLAEEWLTEEDYTPILNADMECGLHEVPIQFIERMEALAPFGMGNPTPRIQFNGLKIKELRTMGKEQQHLKLILSQQREGLSYSVEAVGFHCGPLSDLISPAAQVDVLGELSVNEWNGVRKPQIIIQDLRITHTQVFDWRGGKSPEQKFAAILGKLPPDFDSRSSSVPKPDPDSDSDSDSVLYPGNNLRAIMLFRQEELEALPASVIQSGCAIWSTDKQGIPVPLNDHAQRAPFSQAIDLFLYSHPSSLTQLKSVLAHGDSAQRIYAIFNRMTPSTNTDSIPPRDAFKKVYAALLQQHQEDDHASYISRRSGLQVGDIHFILEVFQELGLIEKAGNTYRCVPAEEKKELTSSERYRQRMLQTEVEETVIYSTSQELVDWIATHHAARNNYVMEDII